LNDKIEMNLQYQDLELLFEVGFCGMMCIRRIYTWWIL